MMLQRASFGSLTASRPARRSVCKAAEVDAPATSSLPVPEWLPEQAKPVLAFFNQTDFDIKSTDLYKTKLAKYLENDTFVKSTGWKALPETINGRAAMLGFLAGSGAELFGAGPLLRQLSTSPQPVLIVLALITAGSIIPIVKGTKGDYLDSLRDTYTLPAGVFTEPNERVHGRLAMVGVAGLIAIELLKGSAVL